MKGPIASSKSWREKRVFIQHNFVTVCMFSALLLVSDRPDPSRLGTHTG